MTDSPSTVACFGAAHIDRLARAEHPVVLGTSNPVTISTALGGVARNVAESLARLGLSVALASRVGTDIDGDRVVNGMTELGVDMTATSRSPSYATAGYTALVEPDGEMAVAMADMAIYDEMTPDSVSDALASLRGQSLWFADCNLPPGSLEFLRQMKLPETILTVDAVSVAKAERLEHDLSGIDLVFCNRDEAAILAGRAGADTEMAEAIRRRGAGAVIVSLGADGALIADTGGCRSLMSVATTVRDVTGAGDALVAGTLFGLSENRPLAECAGIGIAAAAIALESDQPVSEALSPDALLARAQLHG